MGSLIYSAVIVLLSLGLIGRMFGGYQSRRFFRTMIGVAVILLVALYLIEPLTSLLGSVVGFLLTWIVRLGAAAAVIGAIYAIIRIIQNR